MSCNFFEVFATGRVDLKKVFRL